MTSAPSETSALSTLLDALYLGREALERQGLEPFWAAHRQLVPSWPLPYDRAVLGGASADRLGYAFLAGYQAALQALFARLPSSPAAELPADVIVSLCVTEAGGNHPRAINTTIRPTEGGDGWRVQGDKRWSTGAGEAGLLLVIGSIGHDESGLNQLRLVRVSTEAPGLRLEAMPPTPFVPEIPHYRVELDDVAIANDDLLAADAYAEVVKPFRTVEDVHIVGATLGYLVGAGLRSGWPPEVIERLLAQIAAGRGLAQAAPSTASVHLALAGLYGQLGRVCDAIDRLWEQVDEDEAARWSRDRALLDVAGKAREARRIRAWEQKKDE